MIKQERSTSRQVVQALSSVFLAMVIALASPIAVSDQEYAGTVEVQVGQTQVVNAPGVDRVAIGTSGLVEVRAYPEIGQILLIGQSGGESDLRIWDESGDDVRYQLVVTGRETDGPEPVDPEEIRKLFSEVSGIEVVEFGDGMVALIGQARRTADYERAQSLASRFEGLMNEVRQPGLELETTVLIEARLLEVRRSELSRIGVNWNDTVPGASVGWISDWNTNSLFRSALPDDLEFSGGSLPLDSGTNTFTGWAGNWQSVVNLLRTDGVAKTLAEPRLTTVTGESASFQAGGEVPFQVVGITGQTGVEFKDFGILLDILPVADSSGLIRTEVGVEVSSIDDSVSINGQPGFVTRRTDTVMNAREGQAMVISGLFNRQESKDIEAVPGISRIPILGELFKSRAFRDDLTELIIIVTPYLVTADSPRLEDMKQDGERMLERVDQDLQYDIFD
ncbi:MAG: hypothetical protein FKY71_06485 [Spiribacter salinus]|uniref:Uncharacterized protein n=1 Tax=Spiribacter salinus TaxID=1335746 RepID=A0A540VSX4_9GAMM|nr:MAG: hypothetical protein FKY71_06485 [Spiribacter salinus]